MRTMFVDVDGVSTRCLYAGDEKAPPILLLHGHDLISEVWLRNIDPLGEDFYVVAPDMLGSGFTGPSDFGDQPAIPQRVAHLQKLVDVLGFDKFCPCGTSYGALIGTLLYFEIPDRVDKLVINGSASAFNTDEALVANLKANYEHSKDQIDNAGLEFWRERVARGTYDPSTIPEALLVMLTTVYAQPSVKKTRAQSFLSFMDLDASGPYRILNRLEDIKVDTLVTWGRDDKGAHLDTAEQAVARMPKAELVVFDNCAHMMMFEHPDLYNETIRSFLKR